MVSLDTVAASASDVVVAGGTFQQESVAESVQLRDDVVASLVFAAATGVDAEHWLQSVVDGLVWMVVQELVAELEAAAVAAAGTAFQRQEE